MSRTKLKENEAELKDTKNQIKDKQTMVIQADTEFQTVQFKSDPASISRKYALKKAMDILKKEINELRKDFVFLFYLLFICMLL